MRTLWWLGPVVAGLVLSACTDTLAPGDPGNLVPKTVAEDPTLPAVTLNGSRFHVQTFGDSTKPVIVFLHEGPGGDYRSMLVLGDRFNGYSLADDHFLVFWDQRGSGLSERHDADQLTRAIYEADLNALLDRYSPGRPAYLIGISWGGMFATSFINDFPQRVAGAVLIESGPLDGVAMERLKGDIQPVELGAEWLNDYAWSSQFLTADDHARMDFERMLGLKASQPRFHKSQTNPAPGWRQGAMANKWLMKGGQDANGRFTYDFTTHLAAYATPVLFVTGEWSEILGASLQQVQMQRYPHASLTVIPGVGHDVAWIKPAEVLAVVHPYLVAREGGLP